MCGKINIYSTYYIIIYFAKIVNMKIVIIRHADPNYKTGALTDFGKIEANALGAYYSDNDFDDVYCSSLKRALLTAKAVIKKKKIHIQPYLREFNFKIKHNEQSRVTWDFLPTELENDFKDLNNISKYLDNKYFAKSNIKQRYLHVTKNFDKTLEKYGYVREKNHYKVIKSNDKTIVFFCHFGVMAVILSHLLNIPYTSIAQHFWCPPTGVTILASEERRKGIAQFRCLQYGNIVHLGIKGIKPTFSGRFCEQYKDKTRHD